MPRPTPFVLLAWALCSLVSARAWAHYIQIDFKELALRESAAGNRIIRALREGSEVTQEQRAQAVNEALQRLNTLWEEIEAVEHHSRFFSEIRNVNVVGGLITNELEKALLLILLADKTKEKQWREHFLDEADRAYERAVALGAEFKTLLEQNEPRLQPWWPKYPVRDTARTRHSLEATVDYVRDKLTEILDRYANGGLSREEAWGRVQSMHKLEQVNRDGPKLWAIQKPQPTRLVKALASAEVNQAILRAMRICFTGNFREKSAVFDHIERAKQWLELLPEDKRA